MGLLLSWDRPSWQISVWAADPTACLKTRNLSIVSRPSHDVPIIEARGIRRVDEQRDIDLLCPRDFSLNVSERIALTGPSGSGKSVFLRALALLDDLDAGEMRWRGQPIPRRDIPQYRRHIAYVRQRPAMVDGSVADNLRLPYGLAAYRDCTFDEAAAQALAEQAGRDKDFLDRDIGDLSGGEAQIVALIRVLQVAPDVLLLDEPTAALDAQSVQAVETLVTQWFEASPGTRATVWVSHDPEQAQRVGHLHMTMHAGVLSRAPATRGTVSHD